MKRTSAELKRMAREKLRGNWGIMIGANVLTVLIIYALEIPNMLLLGVRMNMAEHIGVVMSYSIISMLIVLFAIILQIGVVGMQLKLARNQKVSLGMMFSQFINRPYRYILASLLLGLLAVVCLCPGYACAIYGIVSWKNGLAALGVILVIAGGVLYFILALKFSLIVYLFLDDSSIGVIAAYRESARIMKGKKGRMFYIILSFIGWMCLGMLSFGIGLLWVIPYMQQTLIQFYLDAKGELDCNQQEEENYICE